MPMQAVSLNLSPRTFPTSFSDLLTCSWTWPLTSPIHARVRGYGEVPPVVVPTSCSLDEDDHADFLAPPVHSAAGPRQLLECYRVWRSGPIGSLHGIAKPAMTQFR